MRCAALALFIVAVATSTGCGELTGAAELADGAVPFDPVRGDTGVRDPGPRPDTATSEAGDAATDAAVSTEPALDGDYFHERIPPTRGVFRLDHLAGGSGSGQPILVFVSWLRKVTVTCDAFASANWALPAGAIVHRVELGSVVPGVYTVQPTNATLLVSGAIAGRAHAGEADFDWADRGTVTIASTDAIGSRGALDLKFDFWFEEDQMTEQHVVGEFDAVACPAP